MFDYGIQYCRPQYLGNHIVNSVLSKLTDIWHRIGEGQVENLNKGTLLWHSGHIPSMTVMDDERALWTTRSEEHKNDYIGSAREGSRWSKYPATSLTLTLRSELRAADFNSASLLQFTKDYCDHQHDQMKRTLRAWCLENKFDAVVSLNSNRYEVVVVRPATSLAIVSALPL